MQTTTKLGQGYESIEFTLNDGTSDYDLDAQQATFLTYFKTNDVGFPSQVKIRTDQTITVKINSASNHAITIPSTDSPFLIEGISIQNLFLSNSSGSNATVRLFFQDVAY